MWIDELKQDLYSTKDANGNYRQYKMDLLQMVQGALVSFTPINNDNYKENPIQLVDFFSGAGGTSLGFAALNSIIPAFKMLGGCDINEVSATTYSRNFGTPIVHEDIRNLAFNKNELYKFLDKIGYDRSKPTVMIGCAPCQGFSSHRKKHWNEEDDVRNSLIMAFAEIVEELQPEVIIMENVPEFLSKRYWSYFSAAKKRYERNGYIVKGSIYNAASFGVPQERFRSIIIGMKKEFVLPIGYLNPADYRTVRDAIEYLPVVPAGVASKNDPMHKSALHKKSTIDVIS